MIELNNLKKLNAQALAVVLKKKGQKKVNIKSNHGLWRKDAKGYTDKVEEAWELTFAEAYEQTKHCGTEKHVRYPYVVEAVEPAVKLACEEDIV